MPATGPGNAEDGFIEEVRKSILQLMSAGLTDEVIARRLGISARTCRRHIAAIMQELGVTSRFAAGVAAVKAGLLPADVPPPEGTGR